MAGLCKYWNGTRHYQVFLPIADTTDMQPNSIARNLRCARRSANLTQDEAEKATGYSIRHIQRLERNGTVNLNVLEVFAAIYGVHVAQLIWAEKERKVVIAALLPDDIRRYIGW